MTNVALVMFCLFVAITLVITWWASARSTTTSGFFTADRAIGGTQNGWAIAGDYMSAASFLGISGLIAFYGFDGFIYSAGWLVGYLTVLFLVAEPLRNAGKYTVGDLIAYRLRGNGVRAVAALSTLVIVLLYMVAQMVGAGSLIGMLIPQMHAEAAIVAVGVLMLVYVLAGGMLATTWVQIIKAAMLVFAALLLCALVLLRFHFSLAAFFAAAASVHVPGARAPVDLLSPGLLFRGPGAALNAVSLGLALVLGTAGLPHILMRFYTVRDARAARTSVAWAMIVIGVFYLTTLVMGFGAATLVGQADIGPHVHDAHAIAYIAHHPSAALNAQLVRKGYIVPTLNSNLAAPLLAGTLGGTYFMAFVAAVAFATILAVVAGLTIAASSAFAHDFWWSVVRGGRGEEREQIVVARAAAVVVGALSIVVATMAQGMNVAFLVGLAFAVAASTNVPVIVLSLTWRRFNGAGAMTGMLVGLISSLAIITISPAFMGKSAIFPLENPGIISIPLGFLGAVVGTLCTRDESAERGFNELLVRANTGMGAEV